MPPDTEKQQWTRAPARPLVSDDEVHVWRASLEPDAGTIEALERVLSAEERQRAGRFIVSADRRRFVVARGLLRTILGRYLARDPAHIRFRYTEHGKPFLDAAGMLSFNLSHSRSMALYAVSGARQLGVDVEYIRSDIDAKGIAARFFSPGEAAALNELPGGLQVGTFFRCWTRNEAYVKARGDGVFFGLDKFDVSLAPGEPAALLRVEASPGESARWVFHDLQVHPDYAGAVAAEGVGWQLRCWDYPS